MIFSMTYTKINSPAIIYRFIKDLLLNTVTSGIAALFIGMFLEAAGVANARLNTFIIVFIFQLIFSSISIWLEYQNLGHNLEKNSINLRKGILSVQSAAIPFSKIT